MPRLLPKYEPKNSQSEEETNNPQIADHCNFYKVEKWMKDGLNVDRMLYAGRNLDKAREVFAEAISIDRVSGWNPSVGAMAQGIAAAWEAAAV